MSGASTMSSGGSMTGGGSDDDSGSGSGSATDTSGGSSSSSSGGRGSSSTGAGLCCEPVDQPPCIEGAFCCANGEWECNNGAGVPPPCDQGLTCGTGSGGMMCSNANESCANGEMCCGALMCCSGVPVPVGQEFCSNNCPISDRNKKDNFSTVDTAQVLAKVAALELTSWNYKFEDPSIRHLGPMAQDFKAAFHLGSTDKAIFTIDADGVALASIQALHAELERIQADNAELRARLAKLEAQVGAR